MKFILSFLTYFPCYYFLCVKLHVSALLGSIADCNKVLIWVNLKKLVWPVFIPSCLSWRQRNWTVELTITEKFWKCLLIRNGSGVVLSRFCFADKHNTQKWNKIHLPLSYSVIPCVVCSCCYWWRIWDHTTHSFKHGNTCTHTHNSAPDGFWFLENWKQSKQVKMEATLEIHVLFRFYSPSLKSFQFLQICIRFLFVYPKELIPVSWVTYSKFKPQSSVSESTKPRLQWSYIAV